MRKTALLTGVLIAGFALAILSVPPKVTAQFQLELTCASGTFPINSPGFTSFNNTTGKYRQWACVDSNGNVSTTMTLAGNSLTLGALGVQGTLTIFGNAGQIATTGAINLGQFNGLNAIAWRKAAGGSDNLLKADSLDQLIWNGAGGITTSTIAFASLPAATNGTMLYCSDCTVASSPCTGSSTGAMAFRVAGAWRCQ